MKDSFATDYQYISCTQAHFMYPSTFHVHKYISCTQAHFMYPSTIHVHKHISCTQAHFMYTSTFHVHKYISCTQVHFMFTIQQFQVTSCILIKTQEYIHQIAHMYIILQKENTFPVDCCFRVFFLAFFLLLLECTILKNIRYKGNQIKMHTNAVSRDIYILLVTMANSKDTDWKTSLVKYRSLSDHLYTCYHAAHLKMFSLSPSPIH